MNTTVVIGSVVLMIGLIVFKVIDYGQYVFNPNGVKECLKCFVKVIGIMCNLDQAVLLQDYRECVLELKAIYDIRPVRASWTTSGLNDDGTDRYIGGNIIRMHESLICALKFDSSMCPDLLFRIR